MNLNGKRIIVTGGASGMGASTVKVFKEVGANVVSIDINEVSKENQLEGVTYLQGDISKISIKEVIDQGVELLGGLDAFFNIAGVNQFIPTEELTVDNIDFVLSVNVKGTILTNQAVFPHLKEHGGSIVNFGSQAAIAPGPDSSHYACSKAAVQAFTNKIAWEWGKYGIRCNTVMPSAWTPLFEKLCCPPGVEMTPELKEQIQSGMKDAFPLGHLGDPETEIAPVLVFLASDESSYMTAQTFAINGGSASVR